jgi:tetratricopeptide (TPR) repeat protein
MKNITIRLVMHVILAVTFTVHVMARSMKQQRPVQQTTPSTTLMLQRAENLIAQKKWKEARALLKTLEKSCGADTRCKANRQFTLGYLFQQEGSQLDSAIICYNKVLEQYPQNAPSYRNMALTYQQQGNTPKAIEVLETAVKKGMTSEFAGKLGDLYTQTKGYEQAIKLYNEALEKDPLSRPLHERLVASYSGGYSNPADIVSHGKQMMNLGFDDLAVNAFVEVIKRHSTNEPLAEHALFLWVIASSRMAVIDIDKIPKEWPHAGFRQLRSLIKSEQKSSTLDLGWWRESVDALPASRPGGRPLRRTAIIGYVLNYVGDQFELKGAIEQADDAYAYAYRIISENDIHSFVIRSERIPDIFYEVAGARGILLTKYPDIDRDRHKFDRMENELFEGKGAAYIDGRTETIMKFHTTLGLIYAARNEWRPSGYRNGIFQLKNAVSKSPEEKNTGYLNMLLAEGYLRNNNRRDATTTLIKAAADFINDDDFFSCDDALRRYDSLNGEKDAKYSVINELLRFRSTLETVADNELNDSKGFTRKVYEATKNSEKKFGQIQRFKIFSDAGSLSLQRERRNLGYYYHSLALLTGDSLVALANLTDIERVNEQVKSVSTSVEFEELIVSASPFDAWPTDEKLPTAKVWKIYEAGSSFETHEIGLTRSLFSGAMVAREINRYESPFYDKQAKFRITADGKIYQVRKPGHEAVLMKYTDFIPD